MTISPKFVAIFIVKMLSLSVNILCMKLSSLLRFTNNFLIQYTIGAENKMDSGKNTSEYRTIQGNFELIIESLASSTDPARFSQKLYKAELVPQHVVEVARVVGNLTPTQRIQPVMVAVLSHVQLQSSKYSDFVDVVRTVYPTLADVLSKYYSKCEDC